MTHWNLFEQNSPDSLQPRMVDKAVMVSKADLLEPREKFHRAGAAANRKCDDEDAPFRPNLEAIREDSCESRSEDEASTR